jgi:hypothetical protein
VFEPTAEPPRANPEGSPTNTPRVWTAIEIVLSVAILLFGLIVIGLQTWLVCKKSLSWSANEVIRAYGLTLIITGALLLVTAGYSNQQMSPVIGLLGSIVGYLLGSSEKSSKAP